MTDYYRCDRCRNEDMHHNRVEIHTSTEARVFRVCPECRALVEKAIRQVIDDKRREA